MGLLSLDNGSQMGTVLILPGDVWQFLETLLVAITEHGTHHMRRGWGCYQHPCAHMSLIQNY